jgi:hypothetical protein
MLNSKENQMSFENRVLAVVSEVTDVNAYFYNGTLFVETVDSAIAVDVFNAIWEKITAAISFVKSGNETAYDFMS